MALNLARESRMKCSTKANQQSVVQMSLPHWLRLDDHNKSLKRIVSALSRNKK